MHKPSLISDPDELHSSIIKDLRKEIINVCDMRGTVKTGHIEKIESSDSQSGTCPEFTQSACEHTRVHTHTHTWKPTRLLRF